MLVKIEEIQEPGLNVTEPIKPAVLDEALKDSDDFALVSSTPLVATFKKVSGRVHVTGQFSATLKAPCKRCLTDVELTVPVEFSLRMIRELPQPDEEEQAAADARAAAAAAKPRRKHSAKKDDDDEAELASTFELDEVDAEPFDGKTIDLDPIVREQVLLALPVSVVCREECKGLCSTCGQDLNAKDCGHSGQKQIDPRLAKLGEIKLKN